MVWGQEQQTAFDALKAAMCSASIAMHPDFSLPYVLYTDASKTAVAGVLTQFRPVHEIEAATAGKEYAHTGRRRIADGEDVREVVVGYFSRINSEQDAKLGATTQECLAVVLSLNHYVQALCMGQSSYSCN
jgi:RNase H-like domain found in reverse transcriptase